MKNNHLFPFIWKSLTLLAVFMSAFILKSYAGGEHYQVYLNDKLILQQGITANGIPLKNIPLDNAKPEDKITIVYRRCHDESSTGRKIAIKDENGKILREWKFSDQSSMTILVKDLMALNKNGVALKVEYSSEQLMEGRTLVALTIPAKKRANF